MLPGIEELISSTCLEWPDMLDKLCVNCIKSKNTLILFKKNFFLINKIYICI